MTAMETYCTCRPWLPTRSLHSNCTRDPHPSIIRVPANNATIEYVALELRANWVIVVSVVLRSFEQSLDARNSHARTYPQESNAVMHE